MGSFWLLKEEFRVGRGHMILGFVVTEGPVPSETGLVQRLASCRRAQPDRTWDGLRMKCIQQSAGLGAVKGTDTSLM